MTGLGGVEKAQASRSRGQPPGKTLTEQLDGSSVESLDL